MVERDGVSSQQRSAAACLGFVLLALAGSLAVIALWQWGEMGANAATLAVGRRSGAAAFSMNLPGLALELAAYAVTFFGIIAMSSTWLWSPGTMRTWYSVGGLLALVPVVVLLAKRFAWL